MYFNCHSWFSLRYGTLSVDALVEQAQEWGIGKVALTDINNTAASLPFVHACQQAGISPVVGVAFHQRTGDNLGKAGQLLYIGLAKNADGFAHLNRWLSHHLLTGRQFPDRAPLLEHCVFLYLVNRSVWYPLDPEPHEYLALMPWHLRSMYRHPLLTMPMGSAVRRQLVLCHPVTLATRKDFALHRDLRAIDQNSLVTQVDQRLLCEPWEHLLPPDAWPRLQLQYPELCKQTEELMEQLSFHYDFSVPKNRQFFLDSAREDWQLLQSLAQEGMRQRYQPRDWPRVRNRLERELEVVRHLGFMAYFLITHDMVTYTRHRGIYHVGRGSGANSLVAYCLYITDVDPLELDLYFERFLNPKRSSPPDFDIDYSWQDRDTAHNYLFHKYGPDHCCLLGAVSTFGDRSVLRELGKAYGLPKAEIDLLERDPAAAANRHHIAAYLLRVLHLLDGDGSRRSHFPNLRTIHAGGVLITQDPIYNHTALDLPPKGFPTAQIDMYTAETIRLEKLDLLSQRGIGHINDAVELVRQNKGIGLNIHDVASFKQDAGVAIKLHSADTIGCFYIESPAMRQLLTKLRCADYLTLVAASSIIRPGVAHSGMMQQYIQNFHSPDQVHYLHPVMKEQLEDTYGVMVYQEDVLKVCHHFAGMDLADADLLRRAMSGKYRSAKAFEQIRNTFFDGCQRLDRPREIAEEVWRQVSSFAGYSFSKAHSASYAVESYQSLFLKTYYPLEFYTAVINNFGGFYSTWVYVHAAQMAGADVMSPCVNHSDLLCKLEGNQLYIGLVLVKGLEKHLMERIVQERATHGRFLGLADFVARVQPGREQLQLLIRVGALRFTGQAKMLLMRHAPLVVQGQQPASMPKGLFAERQALHLLPAPLPPPNAYQRLCDAFDELELLGFPVSLPWFSLLKTTFRGEATARSLRSLPTHERPRMVGLLVNHKVIRTRKDIPMAFATWLDSEGHFFDTTHFPEVWKQYPLQGPGFYLLQGKVANEYGSYSLEVERMAHLEMLQHPLWEERKAA